MRKTIEMLPTTLTEKEYVLAVRSLLKKEKERKYDNRKKNFVDRLKKQRTKIETCIYNEFTLSDKCSADMLSAPEGIALQFQGGLTRDEVVEHFFKKLRKKRRFQRMEWVSVPSCVVTYECKMGECCNSMISKGKYKSGGYFNILTKEYVCKTCFGNVFLHDYYNDNDHEVDVKICSIFPQMAETFAQEIYDTIHSHVSRR